MGNFSYHDQLSFKTKIFNVFRSFLMWPPFEGVLRSLVHGRDPRSLLARVIPQEYLYPKGSWRNAVHHGLNFQFDLSNTTDHNAYFGLRDIAESRLLDLIRPDDRIVDIGANIGLKALPLAKAASNGCVVAFEPHPGIFGRLNDHVSTNGLTNIRLYNIGIGNASTTEALYEVDDHNPGMNRILRRTSGSGMRYTEVKIARLGPILSEAGIDHVDVIKIDVEGYEMEVLKGSTEVIERDLPTLFIELDDANLKEHGSHAGELIAMLNAWNYRIVDAATGSELPRSLKGCHLDILCMAASS